MMMRKSVKILHTVAAAGLTGGLLVYMVLLATAQAETVAAFASLRASIAAISNYVILPSLAIALISGLLSMLVHRPFLDAGWVWIKAALGILMFKGVLTIVGAKATAAANLSAGVAEGQPLPQALNTMLAYEWTALITVFAISVANFVLGVWRPRILPRQRPSTTARTTPATASVVYAPRPEPRAVVTAPRPTYRDRARPAEPAVARRSGQRA